MCCAARRGHRLFSALESLFLWHCAAQAGCVQSRSAGEREWCPASLPGYRCYGNAPAAEQLQTEQDLRRGEDHTCVHPQPKHTFFFVCHTFAFFVSLTPPTPPHLSIVLISSSCSLVHINPVLCITQYIYTPTSHYIFSLSLCETTLRRGQDRCIYQSLRT